MPCQNVGGYRIDYLLIRALHCCNRTGCAPSTRDVDFVRQSGRDVRPTWARGGPACLRQGSWRDLVRKACYVGDAV